MKILKILGTSKEELEKKRAQRLAKSLKRKQEALIDSLEEKKDNYIAEKEKLEDAETIKSKEDSWADDYQRAKIELILINKEINVARDTLKEMFSE